jgi:hypothetical protein
MRLQPLLLPALIGYCLYGSLASASPSEMDLTCGTWKPVVDFVALYQVGEYKVHIEAPSGNVTFYPNGKIKSFSAFNIDDCKVEISGQAPLKVNGWTHFFSSPIDGGTFELWDNGMIKRASRDSRYCTRPGVTMFKIVKTKPGFRTQYIDACAVEFDREGNILMSRAQGGITQFRE